jgi:hypothetical protein
MGRRPDGLKCRGGLGLTGGCRSEGRTDSRDLVEVMNENWINRSKLKGASARDGCDFVGFGSLCAF